ncbi:hypothetical protein UCREL1_1211 [Eutypa lata UCREL1]|uniref:Uncharacterized protein n=1 Tax=Eutypa lata (strain UCR-EL1) TaxID=1287681 RepID=M7TPB6_EUTLA|nr:hypothetical protein UCREL1_1211 [Eutypa lata UCREL1]
MELTRMLLLIGQAGRFVEGEILHVPPALRLFTRETPYLDSLFFVVTCLIAFVLSPLVEILCPVPGHPWTWWHFATSSGFIFALFWVSALVGHLPAHLSKDDSGDDDPIVRFKV